MMQSSLNLNQKRIGLWGKIQAFWTLIKSKQTYLLVLTGWAGFASAACPFTNWQTSLAVVGSLFLAVAGSTVLNMIFDRDIDAKMNRTANRPLPTGIVSLTEAIVFGVTISVLGIGWAFWLNPLYGLIVMGGLFIDVWVYTVLLKRRTPYSIVLGGISGGMPILAGRTLGLGSIDLIGVLLALAILLWIPTHIMTFSMKYADDYKAAGIPTFPSVYGEHTTRVILAWSTALAGLVMVLVAHLLGMAGHYLFALITFSLALATMAGASVAKPSPKLNFSLFKAASAYMMGAMLLIALAV